MTNERWKPDFTKTNPWEGMPADYAGVATFVTTPDYPLPPWEGQVGAEIIPTFNTPEYNALAQRIIGAEKVMATIGTASEKERANIILASAEKATLARAGIVTKPVVTEPVVTEAERIDWGKWAIIGIAVLAVVMLTRK